MNRQSLTSLIAIAFLAAALVGGYFIMKKFQKPTLEPIQKEETGLGGELYDQGKNPAENLPDTNPFQVETNPLEQAKTNPFEGLYKNPFQ